MENKPTAYQVEKAEKRVRGLQSLANLRKSMDMTPLSEASQGTMVELEQIFDSVGAG